jgi:serine/threonine protein phosphatase PrpC
MYIEAIGQSDVGRKRPQNQDTFLVDKALGLYIVCDGMGGHAAGDVASKRAAELAAEILRQHRHDIQDVIEKPGGHLQVVQMVTDSVRAVCQSVYQIAAKNAEYAGMGTTLTMLLVVGEKAVLAHVGDSRMYLLRAGKLHQLTNDHTLTNELIQTGRITPGSPDARRFNHVLTRCIGNQEFVDVETLLFDLLPDDRFLLCSDGQSNYFTDDAEVVRILASEDLRSIPGRLIDLANGRGGNDNITSIVLHVTKGSAEAAAEAHIKLEALKPCFCVTGCHSNTV